MSRTDLTREASADARSRWACCCCTATATAPDPTCLCWPVIQSAVCQSAVCQSAVCQSASPPVCQSAGPPVRGASVHRPPVANRSPRQIYQRSGACLGSPPNTTEGIPSPQVARVSRTQVACRIMPGSVICRDELEPGADRAPGASPIAQPPCLDLCHYRVPAAFPNWRDHICLLSSADDPSGSHAIG
jgi:hypothetical protein